MSSHAAPGRLKACGTVFEQRFRVVGQFCPNKNKLGCGGDQEHVAGLGYSRLNMDERHQIYIMFEPAGCSCQ